MVLRRGERVGWLAGPFASKEDADAWAPAARDEAERIDPWAHFDAVCVARVPARQGRWLPFGVLNARLGLRHKADVSDYF